jgi:hypothetical protein
MNDKQFDQNSIREWNFGDTATKDSYYKYPQWRLRQGAVINSFFLTVR